MITFGVSKKGKYRQENQDAILIKSNKKSGLLIVADGVGGAQAGAEVSSCIVDMYDCWWEAQKEVMEKRSFAELFEELKDLADEINTAICDTYGVGKRASTMALLFIHKSVYGCLSVGDSRIYRYRFLKMECITRDDVWENLPGSRIDGRHKGKLVSAVGGFRHLEYSCITDQCSQGMVFLLCSDGIYRYAKERVLVTSMRYARFSLCCKKEYLDAIVNSAILQDTKDNYSAILVKV